MTDGQDLLARYYPNGKLGGISVDGPCPGVLGQLVELTVRFPQAQRQFTVRGQLSWARHQHSKNLRECFGIDFVALDEGGRERLLSIAKNKVDPESLRTYERVATDLPVRIVHAGVTRREYLADVSLGGAFIRSADPIDPGHPLELHLRPPRALLGFSVNGVVVWSRRTGNAVGMGVKFVDFGKRELERLSALIDRVKHA